MTISPHTRNLVWQSLLDSVRLVHYYSHLWNKQARIRRHLRIILFFAVGGSFSVLIEAAPAWLQVCAALVIGIVVAYDSVVDHSRKVATLKIVSQECAKLEDEFRSLWAQTESGGLSESEILERNRKLEEKLRSATDKVEQLEIRIDSKLNKAAAERAYSIVENRDVPA